MGSRNGKEAMNTHKIGKVDIAKICAAVVSFVFPFFIMQLIGLGITPKHLIISAIVGFFLSGIIIPIVDVFLNRILIITGEEYKKDKDLSTAQTITMKLSMRRLNHRSGIYAAIGIGLFVLSIIIVFLMNFVLTETGIVTTEVSELIGNFGEVGYIAALGCMIGYMLLNFYLRMVAAGFGFYDLVLPDEEKTVLNCS